MIRTIATRFKRGKIVEVNPEKQGVALSTKRCGINTPIAASIACVTFREKRTGEGMWHCGGKQVRIGRVRLG